ncbi:zinc finger BED domain-containing protein RICESLEEPER 2, partial [Tanacetum coccineum]
IQISIVASESAFSTGGRVLDPYRTSVSTKIVKALICTQDWVRKSRKPINVDSLEDLFNDDEIVKDMEYELEKTSENYKGEQNSHWYTLRELEAATDGFVDENVIGQGGMVLYYCFRGIVADGTQVAVKNLLNNRSAAAVVAGVLRCRQNLH